MVRCEPAGRASNHAPRSSARFLPVATEDTEPHRTISRLIIIWPGCAPSCAYRHTKFIQASHSFQGGVVLSGYPGRGGAESACDHTDEGGYHATPRSTAFGRCPLCSLCAGRRRRAGRRAELQYPDQHRSQGAEHRQFLRRARPRRQSRGPNRLLRLRRIREGPLRRDHPPLRGQVRRQGRLPSGRRRAGGAAADRRQDRRPALARRCLLDAERPGARRQRVRHHRQPAPQHHAAERAGPQRERRHRLARLRPWRHRRALPPQPDGHRLRHPRGGPRQRAEILPRASRLRQGQPAEGGDHQPDQGRLGQRLPRDRHPGDDLEGLPGAPLRLHADPGRGEEPGPRAPASIR